MIANGQLLCPYKVCNEMRVETVPADLPDILKTLEINN